MERVNSKKTVLNTMITFALFLALVFCFQLKYVFAEENRVFVVEDLPDSTILMPGDVIYIYIYIRIIIDLYLEKHIKTPFQFIIILMKHKVNM